MYNKCEKEVINIIKNLPNVNEKAVIDFKIIPYTKDKMADFISDTIAMLNSIEAYRKDKYIIFGVVDSTKYPKGIELEEMQDDSHYQNLIDKITPRPIVETGTVKVNGLYYGYVYISKVNVNRVYEVYEDYSSNASKVVKGQSYIRKGSKTYFLSNFDRDYINFQETYIEIDVRSKAISRLLSVNYITRDVAEQILKFDMEKKDLSWAMPQDNSFLVITGDYGSGKTYSLEIMYLRLLEEHKKNVSNVFPVWLTDWSLEAIETTIKNILDFNIAEKLIIFYDELESDTYEKISGILEDTRYLLLKYSNISFIFSSRNISMLDNLDEKRNVLLLNEEEICNLLNLVSNHERITLNHLKRLDEGILETIKRPFFALLFGKLIESYNITEFYTFKNMRIKELMFTNFIDRIFDQEKDVLKDFINISIYSVESYNGEFDLSRVNIQSNLNEIMRKGLIDYNEKSRLYKFNLPVIAQWLASEALIKGYKDSNDLVRSSEHLYKWKYPLVFCLYRINDINILNKIFLPIINKYPAMMGTIIKNGVEKEKDLITNDDISLENIECIINLFKDTFSENDVFFNYPISISLEKYEDINLVNLKEYHDARVITYTFPVKSNRVNGNYYLAYRVISNMIQYFLEHVFLPGTNMYRELLWKISCKAINNGSLRDSPIKVKELLKKSDQLNPKVIEMYKNMLNDGEEYIYPPWPFGDILPDKRSGWVWDRYSKKGLLEKTISVYESAIIDYKYIVENCFDSFKNLLSTYQHMPFEIKGVLNQKDDDSSPGLYQYRIALPSCYESNVNIIWGDYKNYFLENKEDKYVIESSINQYRPNSSHLMTYRMSSGFLNIFGFMPITSIVVDWLIDDLERLDWFNSYFTNPYTHV